MKAFELERIANAVSRVRDPELGGVTIGELGLVRSVAMSPEGRVVVEVTPTFLGCPALNMIAADIVAAGVEAVAPTLVDLEVTWTAVPAWSSSDITDVGTAKLRELGIAVGVADEPLHCPYCSSTKVSERSPVGASACRSLFWCDDCRNVVEVMRSAQRASEEPYPTPVLIRSVNSDNKRMPYVHV
jgi:ring-1,2-phenylacetyl-CoA epoxidase subunit PaaD